MKKIPDTIRIAPQHKERLLEIVAEVEDTAGLSITPTQLMEVLIKAKENEL